MSTNWHVITGCPSSGKTTTAERLSDMGFETVPEAARTYIDEEIASGKTIKEIKRDPADFQNRLLARKIQHETECDPNALTFFDRGIPETRAYYRFNGLDIPSHVQAACHGNYRSIFLLEMLPFETDYSRTETVEEARVLQDLTYDAYTEVGYQPIVIPVDTLENRVRFILDHVNQQ